MNLIFTALLASFLAFIINRHLVAKFGNQAIIYLIPLAEESLKTGLYYIFSFGRSLVAVHLIFGLIEAAFDYIDNRISALLALLSHLLFGYLSIFFLSLTEDLLLVIILTALVHAIWNYSIGRLLI